MIIVDHTDINKYGQTLQDPAQPIAERVDALFCLRSFKELDALKVLFNGFYAEKKNERPSELLMHEICYCLGQMDNSPEHIKEISTFLEAIVANEDEPDIVIHEAVEALGNLNDENSLKLLE